MTLCKVLLPEVTRLGNANINPGQPADHAAWIWHPALLAGTPAFVTFACDFTVPEHGDPLRIHVTADQRFELYLDGERIARGPDRSDIEHWSFATYELTLRPGAHRIEAEVWCLGSLGPEALMSWRGGFLLRAEGAYDAALTTGRGPWQVAERSGWSTLPQPYGLCYHVIGSALRIDGRLWHGEPVWRDPAVVRAPIRPNNLTGLAAPGWRLFPSTLPEQIDQALTPGRFRALVNGPIPEDRTFTRADEEAPDLARWNALLRGGAEPVAVPANSTVTLLWDLEVYRCGYGEFTVDGGAGAEIEWLWAESLFLPDPSLRHKGQRDAIEGKRFLGFGHTYVADGARGRNFRPYWWSSGRFVRLRITTSEEPVRIRRLAIGETRYPLTDDGRFDAGDPSFADIRTLGLRALQMCSHESYMDCPYYEQLMYVGDTRLELLTTYVLTADPRLPRRAIALFDFSRREFEFVAERYPSRTPQHSPTFSLIWIWAVRDLLLWRGDANWIADRMLGVRASLEQFRPYRNADGLLVELPGWSFVDWVPTWDCGYPPGARDDVSSIVNLHYLLSLQAAAELETHLGETTHAVYYREQAERLAAAIRRVFWNEERGLLADDRSGAVWSEHAQCLAILADLFDPETEARVFAQLLAAGDLARTTIYFRHYLFEVFRRRGRTDLLLAGFGFWRDLIAQGFTTTVETPEPSRSDCHAWGAHPIFHMTASLLGLWPLAVGMREIEIRPQPAGLPFLRGETPSPLGNIIYDLRFEGAACRGRVVLPDGMRGRFVWQGRTTAFEGTLRLP